MEQQIKFMINFINDKLRIEKKKLKNKLITKEEYEPFNVIDEHLKLIKLNIKQKNFNPIITLESLNEINRNLKN